MLRSGGLAPSRLPAFQPTLCHRQHLGADVHVLQATKAHSGMSDSPSVLQEWATPMSTLSRSEGRPSGPAFSPLAASLFPASGSVGLANLPSQLSQQCLQWQPVLSSSVQHSAWLVLQHGARVDPAAWAASRKQIPTALERHVRHLISVCAALQRLSTSPFGADGSSTPVVAAVRAANTPEMVLIRDCSFACAVGGCQVWQTRWVLCCVFS